MDNFYYLLNKVLKSRHADDYWTKEYQDAVDNLFDEVSNYAKSRFNTGYDMGLSHAKSLSLDDVKHQIAVDRALNRTNSDIELPGIWSQSDFYGGETDQ